MRPITAFIVEHINITYVCIMDLFQSMTSFETSQYPFRIYISLVTIYVRYEYTDILKSDIIDCGDITGYALSKLKCSCDYNFYYISNRLRLTS